MKIRIPKGTPLTPAVPLSYADGLIRRVTKVELTVKAAKWDTVFEFVLGDTAFVVSEEDVTVIAWWAFWVRTIN